MNIAKVAMMAALAGLLMAQNPLQDSATSQRWETTVTVANFAVPSMVVVPNSATLITASTPKTANTTVSPISGYVRVERVILSNVTGGAITVTLTDNSANCNAGVCNLLAPTLSIAANTTVTYNLMGVPAIGGVKWSASAANSINGWIQGTK